MNYFFLFFFCLFLSSNFVEAQQSLSEYPALQREALETFLAKNNYQFISETAFEKETLKAARNDWGYGKNFKPYYQEGDFNRDGVSDFAVVLTEKGVKKDLFVAIFNGLKGGQYQAPYLSRETFSPALFIATGKQGLYVAVMETDSAGCFVSQGKAYQIKPCGE